MNIFQLSISTLVFGSTLLLGTTAVLATRFVITTVASLTKPAAVSETVVVPAAKPEQVASFVDLRNELPSVLDDFEPSGSYSLITDEVPVAFDDIGSLVIKTREYSSAYRAFSARPVIPTGILHGSNWSYSFTKIAVGNRELSFETETQDGVNYQFIGHFPISSEYIACQGCENPADLKGRLKKLKNGNVIAELDANFYAYRR